MSDQESTEVNYGGSTVEAPEAMHQMLEGRPEGLLEGQEVEQKPEETEAKPEVSAQEEKFAAKFAALSRKEKQLRAQESKLQQQMQELEAKVKAMENGKSEIESYKSLPDRLKREPLKVLEEQGLSFEQLAQMVLNDGKPTQDMVLNEYEKKFMSKIEELEQRLAEKEAQEKQLKEQQALEAFTAQLTDFVANTPDYELIRANDAVGLVYDVIEQHFAETGEILSNKDASDAVEEYLLEEAKKLVDRDKVKKLLQPQQPKAAAQPGKSSPTLSNAQAAQASNKEARFLSNEESLAAAAKLIRWED